MIALPQGLTALLSLFHATLFGAAPTLVFELQTGHTHQQVSLAADFTDWKPWPMNEDQPGHYSLKLEEPWRHGIAYKFIVDGNWISDPNNLSQEPDGNGGANSLRPTSFTEDPLLTLQPGAPALTTELMELVDLEGSPREVTVLLPHAGLEKDRPNVTVYFQDGGDYLKQTGATALLANLSREPGMPALTGVFIPPKDRMREYEFLPAYADFVTHVVVPAVEKRWPSTGGSRTRRLLVGPSLGGLITLFTALRSPETWGYAASQSGSIWLQDGAILSQMGAPVKDPDLRLKLFMDCGTYEDADMPKYNRLGAAAAREAGHQVVYREYPSTHDWLAWRNRLQEILRYFY